MFHQEGVWDLMPGLTPYPEDIFVPEQAWLAKHFVSMISIDLGILRPELKGTVVHMLDTVGPYDGTVGEYTQEFYNEFTCRNWLAFELTQDNRYRFLGKEEFLPPVPTDPESYEGKFAAEVRASHAQKKAYYLEHGIQAFIMDNGEVYQAPWLHELGGWTQRSNWPGIKPPPAFPMELDWLAKAGNDVAKLSYQGRPFLYVGKGRGYYSHADAAVVLFYEPQSRIVLFTYDWS